jgi:hypothetical protein
MQSDSSDLEQKWREMRGNKFLVISSGNPSTFSGRRSKEADDSQPSEPQRPGRYFYQSRRTFRREIASCRSSEIDSEAEAEVAAIARHRRIRSSSDYERSRPQLNSSSMASMIPFVKGVLVTTDIPAKELIVFLNRENGGKIVLKELDDNHLLINPAYVDYVKSEVARLLDQNYYELPEGVQP